MSVHKIPKVFYDDHVHRDLPAGRIVKQTKQHYHVELSDEEHHELLSDANHYADPNNDFQMPGLSASARATARALTQESRSAAFQDGRS